MVMCIIVVSVKVVLVVVVVVVGGGGGSVGLCAFVLADEECACGAHQDHGCDEDLQQ